MKAELHINKEGIPYTHSRGCHQRMVGTAHDAMVRMPPFQWRL
ncbi:MAG: hypothetical protein V4724_20645 [Pseudomonadota bacterium]